MSRSKDINFQRKNKSSFLWTYQEDWPCEIGLNDTKPAKKNREPNLRGIRRLKLNEIGVKEEEIQKRSRSISFL